MLFDQVVLEKNCVLLGLVWFDFDRATTRREVVKYPCDVKSGKLLTVAGCCCWLLLRPFEAQRATKNFFLFKKLVHYNSTTTTLPLYFLWLNLRKIQANLVGQSSSRPELSLRLHTLVSLTGWTF